MAVWLRLKRKAETQFSVGPSKLFKVENSGSNLESAGLSADDTLLLLTRQVVVHVSTHALRHSRQLPAKADDGSDVTRGNAAYGSARSRIRPTDLSEHLGQAYFRRYSSRVQP